MAVDGPRAGAVNGGGLTQFVGDAAQTGQIERHHVAGKLPGRWNGNGQHAILRVRIPNRLKDLFVKYQQSNRRPQFYWATVVTCHRKIVAFPSFPVNVYDVILPLFTPFTKT